jgi:short-subunit dehydrogenase
MEVILKEEEMAKKQTEQSEQRPLGAVTGASTGIGFELAKEFVRNGFDVVIVSDEESIHDVAEELEELGGQAIGVQADLRKRKGVEAFYEAITETGRPLEAIALNAGIGFAGAFAESELEEQLSSVNLNCASVVHLTHLVLPEMVERGEGKILITSSIASQTPGPYMTVYHATKAFDQFFAHGLRVELQESGVTVTSLMPGPTDTEFFERGHMEDTKIGASENKDSAEEVARQGFEAMMAGRDHVVGGAWKNTMEVIMAKFMPEALKAKQTAPMAKPGSAKEQH